MFLFRRAHFFFGRRMCTYADRVFFLKCMCANVNVEYFTRRELQAIFLHSLIAVFLPTRNVGMHRKGYPIMMDSQPRSLLIEPLPGAIKKSCYFFISLLKAEIEVRREKDPSRILRHRYDGNSNNFGPQERIAPPRARRIVAVAPSSSFFILPPAAPARP